MAFKGVLRSFFITVGIWWGFKFHYEASRWRKVEFPLPLLLPTIPQPWRHNPGFCCKSLQNGCSRVEGSGLCGWTYWNHHLEAIRSFWKLERQCQHRKASFPHSLLWQSKSIAPGPPCSLPWAWGQGVFWLRPRDPQPHGGRRWRYGNLRLWQWGASTETQQLPRWRCPRTGLNSLPEDLVSPVRGTSVSLTYESHC